ncbi:hypothetical protein H2248_010361 [Termitomyces sp. 'cryptogamus']|nr:hypothetical protein H2248_010361 [Termitomyces sp. 'cryptogamus']
MLVSLHSTYYIYGILSLRVSTSSSRDCMHKQQLHWSSKARTQLLLSGIWSGWEPCQDQGKNDHLVIEDWDSTFPKAVQHVRMSEWFYERDDRYYFFISEL